MQILRDMEARLRIAGELLAYMWQHKMWWMIPLVAILLFMGLVIGFGAATGVGPFMYTLF